MIAKVIAKEREYYSNVFAKFNLGFKETVIVFDNKNEQFELLNVYDNHLCIKRKIFIFDTDISDMIEKTKIRLSLLDTFNNCVGYDWLISNTKLIKNIKNHKKVDDIYLELAKKMNEKLEISEWKYVKNEKDANDLLEAAFWFHDSILDHISYKVQVNYNDPSVVELLFTGCWECDIMLVFESDVLIHFNRNDVDMYEIMDSNILFDDFYVYWVDDDLENINQIDDSFTYFRGRSLKWKMITKK